MAQYTRGRIAVVEDSLTVTGTDTLWFNNISVGDVFKPKNISIYGTVAAVVSDTEITLNSAWLGGTLTNSEYQLTRDFTAAFDLYEISNGDVNWPYYITQNFRKIDNLFDIMAAGVISADILAARDEAVAAVGNVDLSVIAAAGSADAAEVSATAALASQTAAAASATAAGDSATAALASQTAALASAVSASTSALQSGLSLAITNYVGAWSDLTGALAIPASVSYDGSFWKLVENVADVTTQVPGVATAWQIFNIDMFERVIGSSGCLVYDSVASMIADDFILIGETIDTTAYYSDTPGGGARYTIVAANTGTSDSFLYHDLNNGLQAKLVIDNGIYYAKQAGIRADGTTDDSTRIATVLGSLPANTVFVFNPSYTYSINMVSVNLAGNQTIIAYGAIFRCTTDARAFNLNLSNLTNRYRLKWRGGVFNNISGTRLASQAIWASNFIDIDIEDAAFTYFFKAIDINDSIGVNIEKNFFNENITDVDLAYCKANNVSKNFFASVSSDGVVTNNCDNTSIGQNTFSQTIAGGGVPVTTSTSCTKIDIGQNYYADAKILALCERNELTFWPYKASQYGLFVSVPGYQGDLFATGSATIDMSSIFSPLNIIPKGYDIHVRARDAASSTSLDASVSIDNGSYESSSHKIRLMLGGYGLVNGTDMTKSGYVPADSLGRIRVSQVSGDGGSMMIWVHVSAIIL